MLQSAGDVISVEEESDGTRVYRVRHKQTYFSWLPPDEAYDRAQARMGRWFVEECENDAEVARLAIEALQAQLDAAGGPEDARARATLRYLLEIVAASRRELVNFPRLPAAGP